MVGVSRRMDSRTQPDFAYGEAGENRPSWAISPHTIAAMAFCTPVISDWSYLGQWTGSGSVDAARRANQVYRQVNAGFDGSRVDDGFSSRRTAEDGAPPEP